MVALIFWYEFLTKLKTGIYSGFFNPKERLPPPVESVIWVPLEVKLEPAKVYGEEFKSLHRVFDLFFSRGVLLEGVLFLKITPTYNAYRVIAAQYVDSGPSVLSRAMDFKELDKTIHDAHVLAGHPEILVDYVTKHVVNLRGILPEATDLQQYSFKLEEMQQAYAREDWLVELMSLFNIYHAFYHLLMKINGDGEFTYSAFRKAASSPLIREVFGVLSEGKMQRIFSFVIYETFEPYSREPPPLLSLPTEEFCVSVPFVDWGIVSDSSMKRGNGPTVKLVPGPSFNRADPACWSSLAALALFHKYFVLVQDLDKHCMEKGHRSSTVEERIECFTKFPVIITGKRRSWEFIEQIYSFVQVTFPQVADRLETYRPLPAISIIDNILFSMLHKGITMLRPHLSLRTHPLWFWSFIDSVVVAFKPSEF